MVRVGDIVTFIEIGTVYKVVGDVVYIRNPQGKKIIKKQSKIRIAHERDKENWDWQHDAAVRHGGAKP